VAFSDRIKDFKKLNCELLGISVDSEFSHLAWINTPRKHGGLGGMHFPLVSDLSKKISKNYGVLLNGEVALRQVWFCNRVSFLSVFLILSGLSSLSVAAGCFLLILKGLCGK
jgi:alkyl hydroperoxide reductase subunit AhpC